MVQSVIYKGLDALELILMGMNFRGGHLVLRLVLLPVEEALEVPEGVVRLPLVEFASDFALAGGVHTAVVNHELARLGVA